MRTISNVRLNLYSQPYVMDTIEKVCKTYNLCERWAAGPFGHFLDVNQRKGSFPGALILRLLARELVGDQCRRDEVWFGIGNKAARFGKQEFLMVTGLPFGRISPKVLALDRQGLPSGNVYMRICRDQKLENNRAILKFVENSTDLDSDDALKILYAVFVERFLIGAEGDRPIKKLVWHMVEDLEKFEKFPWGTFAFSHTLDGIRKVIKPSRQEAVKAYNIYGCAWSIAVRHLYK